MIQYIIPVIIFIIVLFISIKGQKKFEQIEKEDPSINKYLGDKF